METSVSRARHRREGTFERRSGHVHVDLVPGLIDGDDAGIPVVVHVVLQNAVIGEERIDLTAAAPPLPVLASREAGQMIFAVMCFGTDQGR